MERNISWCWLVLLLLVCKIALAGSFEIEGQVRDNSSTRLPGLRVLLRSADGRAIADNFTDEDGRFRFSEIPPSPSYYVEVLWGRDLLYRNIVLPGAPDTTAVKSLDIVLGGPRSTRDDLNERARNIAQLLSRGDFRSVRDQFSPTLLQQLNESLLRAGYQKLISTFGTMAGIEDTKHYSPDDGTTVVDVKTRHAGGVAVVRVVFDREQKISGLWWIPVNS